MYNFPVGGYPTNLFGPILASKGYFHFSGSLKPQKIHCETRENWPFGFLVFGVSQKGVAGTVSLPTCPGFLSVFFRFFPFSFRFFPLKKKRGDTVRETPFAKPRGLETTVYIPSGF